jgi:nitrile hydratase subunit beta
MNGIHDMGGMQDMGPILPEKGEPVFHAPWEGRVFALRNAVDGDWPYGAMRHQRDSVPPADYLRISYYERWLTGLVELMIKTGMVTRAEVASGEAAGPATRPVHVLRAEEVAKMIAVGGTTRLQNSVSPRFQEGQRVRAKNINPEGHTRLPRYARGKVGTIARDHGVFVFPDSSALGLGPKPQHVYSVRLAARELWGEQASRRDSVYVDMFDDYLEPA